VEVRPRGDYIQREKGQYSVQKTLDQILQEAAPAVKDLPSDAMKARGIVRDAIRRIEERVLRSLDGVKLLGQPNLGKSRDRYNGINVRADSYAAKLCEGKPTLVIDRDGSLVVVCYGRDEIVVEPLDLARVDVDDLDAIWRGYSVALTLHVAAAKEASLRYEKIKRVALVMREALDQFDELVTSEAER